MTEKKRRLLQVALWKTTCAVPSAGEHTGTKRVSHNPSEEAVNLQPSVLSNLVFITFLFGMDTFQENNALRVFQSFVFTR